MGKVQTEATNDVRVDAIQTIDRILPPTQERIDAMANALGERGQFTPILITKHGDGWRVVAGATRLAAAVELGWPTIKTIIITGTELELQLVEVEENLERGHWTDAEHALLKAKHKELRAERLTAFETALEETPPAPAKGGRGKKGGVRAAARKAGVPKSTAHRRAAKVSQTENGTVSGRSARAPTLNEINRELNEASKADLDAKWSNYIAEPETSKRVTNQLARDLLTQFISHCLQADPNKVTQALRKNENIAAKSINELAGWFDRFLAEIKKTPPTPPKRMSIPELEALDAPTEKPN